MSVVAKPVLADSHVALRGVGKVYRTAQATLQAVSKVDLHIRRGSVVGLLGPSGCGKSTLLAMVAGLETPTSGVVELDGAVLTGANTAAGMMFQRDLLLDWRSVIDNVLLQFEMRGIDTEPHRRRAGELLRMVGLESFEQSRPTQLSGGMRQRVAICRALVHAPSLLLMDEPFGALDAISREKITLDVARLAADAGTTVLFVTHSIEEAVFLGDRVIVMSARPGAVIADFEVDVPRPRKAWPRGASAYDPYVDLARSALERGGAYAAVHG